MLYRRLEEDQDNVARGVGLKHAENQRVID
jgi:hypothetical protein